MTEAKDRWLTVEADHEGRPLLIRARIFAAPAPVNPRLDTLMVMDRAYPVIDGVALPTSEDYRALNALEAALFDEGERLNVLMLVLVQTGAGRVRYFAYTADPEAVMERLNTVAGADYAMDLSAAADPEWSIYERMVEGLG